jgi:hypothetical protein
VAATALEDHLTALLGIGYGVAIEQPAEDRYEVTLISMEGDQSGAAGSLPEAFRAAFQAPLIRA